MVVNVTKLENKKEKLVQKVMLQKGKKYLIIINRKYSSLEDFVSLERKV